MKTKRDLWAEEYIGTAIFNNVVANQPTPEVDEVWKAGFEKCRTLIHDYLESFDHLTQGVSGIETMVDNLGEEPLE